MAETPSTATPPRTTGSAPSEVDGFLQNRSRLSGRRSRLLALAELTESATVTSEALITQAEELGRVHGCIALLNQLQRSEHRADSAEER